MNEWISVKDRLPEEGGYYLCYHEDWAREVVLYSESKGFDTIGASSDKPTHWMPLPEPPKESK